MRAARQRDGSISLGHKTAFGIGGMGDTLMQKAVNNMASQVLHIQLGVNPALVSIAIFASNLWDAVADPVVGAVSDNARGRFGRRRPFMLIGGVGGGLLFMLLWQFPLVSSQTGLFLWFLFAGLAFYTFYSLFGVPYDALGFELSHHYNERTRLMAFKFVFATIAAFAMQWQFKLTQLERFDNTLEGMQTVAVFVGLIIMVATVIPALFCRERFAREIGVQRKVRLLESMDLTFRNRPFRILMLSLVFCSLGLFMVTQMGTYINIYYIYGGDIRAAATMVGMAGSAYHLMGGILAPPLISWIAARIGKKRMLLAGLGLAVFGAASKFFTYSIEHPFLQLASLAVMSPGLACLWILTSSMLADICDEDELENGTRREGMFSAVHTFILRLGASAGVLLTGFILNATGFDIDLGAAQSHQTLLWLRILHGGIPAVGLLIALLLVVRFPITPQRAAEVRRLLDERHAERKPAAHD